MKRNVFLDKLNKFLCKLNKKYCINDGGCCFVASILAEMFDKYNIKYSLVIQATDYKDSKEVENEIKSNKANYDAEDSCVMFGTCDHYSLQVENYGIINDYQEYYSDGCPVDYYYYKFDNISAKDIAWIYSNGIWNTKYSIKQNKLISNLLKDFFKWKID